RIVGIWKQGVAFDRIAYKKNVESLRTEAGKPGSSVPENGLVSDFDQGKASANFGAGWQVSTDEMRGGKSTAKFRVIDGGAQGSKGCLQVEGEVVAELQYAWAGALFFPGPQPMAPANLSTKKAISFWAKGDGRTYNIMLFAASRGF